ncbi:MAG: cob(I)yrinic acid a,c-diamide adenosyltransferase [Phycisphaerales bacterium]|nr:cob(I)yrinic acid a,c-diamide adenosyltransferase [Phycisphaerales bacterium]
MVRLSKIYTKTGDDGTTGLGDGSRVDKTDLRVESYGTVDEANAAIGLCVIEAGRDSGPHAGAMAKVLTTVQNDLFDVGADLCCPIEPGEKPGSRLRVTPSQTERLEGVIDLHNERLKPLDSFILPGGSPLAAHLHLARTITRRAERVTVALLGAQGATTNPETVRYLNRLSDLLFVLGRVANGDGAADVKWIPGAHRT